ncbi:MAG: hypothetical protein KGN80_00060 [Acidobacteriota bacterium]|nr:hypothetical protein [Acidobacteriota bacterium]
MTSTVVVEVSNDGVNPAPSPLWTATINAASPAGDSFTINNAYAWVRAKTTAISASSLVKVYIGA